ncbi:beta galactosidase [Dichotomocladium elegans]|nr:beta galactosidase [Dichotomocladium elegans]
MAPKISLSSISLALVVLVSIVGASTSASAPRPLLLDQRDTNGLTDKVTWDNYSLMVDGERLFLFSGEFHYYRLPSPSLWLDILQKYKAIGMNGVSFYFNWGYHSAKKGVYDFDGVRDITKAFSAAEQTDLHVITRSGPYINAEVDCGGFPGWLTTMYSMARRNNPENNENFEEWLTQIDKYLHPNQITEGGKIILNQIDNEYSLNSEPAYLEAIKAKFLKDGIVVPSIYNDPGPKGHFVHGPGSADLYGWDKYPANFDCSNPMVWPNNRSTDWRDYHYRNNPEQPLALYEFQGGSFDPWGGPGYEACRTMVDERFAKVFYKNNYAQGATIQNLYMAYGGTSWGGLAKPSVYTSYDYGSPISEPGLMTSKAYEIKLQGTFIHTVKPFWTTSNFTVVNDNSEIILVDGLKDVNSDTKFYIAQHWNTPSNGLDEFHITVDTTDGTFEIPQSGKLVLNGRDAKILTADYAFNSQHLVYSTSEIFTHQDMGSHDAIVVYGYEGEDGEFVSRVKNNSSGRKIKVKSTDKSVQHTVDAHGLLRINYRHPNGTTPIYISGTGTKDLLVLVSGYESAQRWWAPVVDDATGQRVLIQGPYLVRSASVSGNTVHFKGDIDETTAIEVVVPTTVKRFTWNGRDLKLKPNDYGTWTGSLTFIEPEMTIPDLGEVEWNYSEASPEIQPDFDHSNWITATKQKTNSITLPQSWPILYADDYGFHTGCIWFRGTFNGSSQITGFNLTAVSGAASAWVVWLNGEYLGGFDVGNQAFTNLNGTLLKAEGENVISLLLWTTGHEDDFSSDDGFKAARGFSFATLLGPLNQTLWSIDWKIQGNLGGEDLADPVRGPYNEGGLYGERMGWHLPDFPDNDWETTRIPESQSRTGVSWYRTTVDVHIPTGYEVPISINIEDTTKARYRALIFVNGWQFGRYANDLGPQTQFYIPAGILNTQGKNTLAVAVVPLDKNATLGKITMTPYKVLESAIPPVELVMSPGYSVRDIGISK